MAPNSYTKQYRMTAGPIQPAVSQPMATPMFVLTAA